MLRHHRHELIEQAKAQGLSPQARRDRIRRRYLMEGSFAQAANCHGFKRARWRRLWRQQIQDWLIAACQNVKILTRTLRPAPQAAPAQSATGPAQPESRVLRALYSLRLAPCWPAVPNLHASPALS